MTRTDSAEAWFLAKLTHETDVSDVHAALETGRASFVLVDVRDVVSWDQGHVPGAVHLPNREIADRLHELPPGADVVTYCWGPGCNGATRGALALARAGRRVREMIGGFEYWVREGLPVETAQGRDRRAVDPLTAPVGEPVCGC